MSLHDVTLFKGLKHKLKLLGIFGNKGPEIGFAYNSIRPFIERGIKGLNVKENDMKKIEEMIDRAENSYVHPERIMVCIKSSELGYRKIADSIGISHTEIGRMMKGGRVCISTTMKLSKLFNLDPSPVDLFKLYADETVEIRPLGD